MSGQCIAVVSGKGGTGKTSLTAGVGTALAQSGKRVLCVDCDIGLRNLDLALGLTDRALMDFSDVALDRCRNENELLTASDDPNRTYIEEIMPAKLALDLEYIPCACVSYDIKLILETLVTVVRD